MQLLAGTYDHRLVALSVLIAVLASYAALDLAGRVTSARGRLKRLWLGGGATAMGLGIWSMHYVGMLAFRLPVSVKYDWPTVLLSLAAAIVASAVALYVTSRETMGALSVVAGSLVMGGGIAAMHYIGMSAMRLAAMCNYSAVLVTVSIVLAVVISLLALVLTFRFRSDARSALQKLLTAAVMGSAIPVMHYTGMAAARFVPAPQIIGDLTHSLNITSLGLTCIILVTFMVLGLTILTSLVDRRFSAQALELAESERLSRQILETSFDPFIAMDGEGTITDWNAQAESVFGWPKRDVLGTRFAQLVLGEKSSSLFEQRTSEILSTSSSAATAIRFEIAAFRRDGTELPVEVTISATGNGDARRLAAFVRDLTERKRAEKALLDAKETAEAANHAKSTFLATMSHEIRTPMNGILGMTELVLDTDLSEEQRENLGLVRVSAESLLSIINDILDFSKIEAGKLEVESIPFDLREMVGETMKAMGIRAHQKGLELVYDVSSDVNGALLGDPGRIRQVVINLVGNSVKFTERGEVFVKISQDSQEGDHAYLHFQVKDTGIGIAPDKQDKIFEAFSQADGSMARKYGGTGLGLAICTRLIEMMGGRIWLESELGKGSTFHFTLRLGIQKNSVKPGTALQPEQLRDVHVLVVDDNYTNRRVLSAMLTGWGMRPTAVEGGRAALQALDVAKTIGHPFPLVLLVDGQIAEMDGFTLAGMIKKDPELAGTAIMMLTSAGHRGDAARCRELGISAYLVKPTRQSEVLEAICGILRTEPGPQRALVTQHSLREARSRLRVLLAEDNKVNQTLAVRLLEKQGYSVSVAANGREALTVLALQEFDLILMDVQMPEMDGLETTKAIREMEKTSGKHVPIIAMTAHALKGDEQKCLSAGMDGYVSKPIRTGELFSAIEEAVRPRDLKAC
jgi:two-component system, sensor histidine kinase and response regulator